ncbi:HEPN domain-containing protein [Candidatus Woesearchaeota archaeon]|nr:HEPN domain-containing protein [Candidatus Woesearchaeota archaeon]
MRPEIERWLLQSEEELSTAEVCFKGEKWFAVAFWCQQAVEKALKALFMLKKKESPGTTHSLTYLARETKIPKEFSNFAASLTKEYYLSRYPDASEDVPFKIYTKENFE